MHILNKLSPDINTHLDTNVQRDIIDGRVNISFVPSAVGERGSKVIRLCDEMKPPNLSMVFVVGKDEY